MALNIKNAEVDRLARELARRQGVGVTEAVRAALEAELERERARVREPGLVEKLTAIAERCRSLPILDPRDPDEILYDEHGLPRSDPDPPRSAP